MSQVATRSRPRRVTGRPPRLLLAAGALTAVVALIVRPVVHEFWPEAPDDDGAIMYGEQAHFARPGHT